MVIMSEKAESALSLIIEGSTQLQQDGPGPSRVLLMSGAPLSGKSHLVNLIEKKVPGSFLLVRSDFVRPTVAKCLGRKRPAYDDIEHVTTFIVSGEVIRTALTLNWPVIADATNLKEDFRGWVYSAADDLKADVIVVFMQVTDELATVRLSERRRHGSAATLNVYNKLKYEMEAIGKCTRPYIIINSNGDMRPYAKYLSDWLTGKTDTVPGLKRPRAKKALQEETEQEVSAAEPAQEVHVSEPSKTIQTEEISQKPEPVLSTELPKKKQVPKGAKRIIYDFYTGEEIEID